MEIGIIGLGIVIANFAFSYKGFTNKTFFEEYRFDVDQILINKDYKRLITSGFLHSGWLHLIINMLSLYGFCGIIEHHLGGLKCLSIYMLSLVGGGLFALYIHRNHGSYTAIGASGAVCGIIFATIALFPDIKIGFFGLPFFIPSWLYGLLYVLYSIYGIRSQHDNIGHEAHLGGALIGMSTALIITPSAFLQNYLTILIISVPTIAFIYLIVSRPHILLIKSFQSSPNKNYFSIDHKYNEEKTNNQKEIDLILDKIKKSGINSLSKKEKEKLNEYSSIGN
jgi:membrane associated rhomboid family serine protease